jgi:hypothetical protein
MTTRKPATRKPAPKPTRPRRDFAAEEASRTRAQVKLWLAVDGLAAVDELAAALGVDRGAATVTAARALLADMAGDEAGVRAAVAAAPSLVAKVGRKPKTAAKKEK